MKPSINRRDLPPIEAALLTHLAEVFPSTLPGELIPDTQLARLIGQQDVIRYLRDTGRIQDRK